MNSKKAFTIHIKRSRNGKLLGVCDGIAKHFAVHSKWVRLAMILLAIFTSVIPAILLYLFLAYCMDPEPEHSLENHTENEYRKTPQKSAQSLKQKLDSISKRIQNLEHKVTQKDFQWQKKFENIK